MKKFELKTWLSNNRETVITKYEELTKEKYFSGITLKSFMVQIMNAMLRNNVRSEKRANSMLSFLMGEIYFNNSKVNGNEIGLNNSMISENSKGQLPSSMR